MATDLSDHCPCCTAAPLVTGKRVWTLLCDRCAGHVFRMQPCWHEFDAPPADAATTTVVEAS